MRKGYNGEQKTTQLIYKSNVQICFISRFFLKFTLKMKEQKAIFKTADVKTS